MRNIKTYLLQNGQIMVGTLNDEILEDTLTVVLNPKGGQMEMSLIPIIYPVNLEPLNIEVKNLQHLYEFDPLKNAQIKQLVDNYEEAINQLKSKIIQPKSNLIY